MAEENIRIARHKRIIGITGLRGSGRRTIAGILAKIGYRHCSSEELISEYAKKHGINKIDNDKKYDKLKELYGEDFMVQTYIERYSGEKIVIESISTVAQAKRINQYGTMIAVSAPEKTRYERASGDESFEEFKNKEKTSKEKINKVIEASPIRINNSRGLEELKTAVISVISKNNI